MSRLKNISVNRILLAIILSLFAYWISLKAISQFEFSRNPIKIGIFLHSSDSTSITIINEYRNVAIDKVLTPEGDNIFEAELSTVPVNTEEFQLFFKSAGSKISIKHITLTTNGFSYKIEGEALQKAIRFTKRSLSDHRLPQLINSSLLLNEDGRMFLVKINSSIYKTLLKFIYKKVGLYSLIIALLILVTSIYVLKNPSGSLHNIVFIGFFSAILVYFITGPSSQNSNEKRDLTQFPDIFNTDLKNIPTQIESWYSDHFPFRNSFPTYLNYAKLLLFKESPVPEKVLVGKQNWLFSSEPEVVSSYVGNPLFTNDELLKIKKNIEERRDYLFSIGSSYHLMILPVKAIIYPEYLPEAIKPNQDFSRYDQVIKYLSENSDISIVRTKEYLLSKKDSVLLYYESDTHWNQLGGFYGYQALIDEINASTKYNLKRIKESDLSITVEDTKNGDLLSMINLRDKLSQTTYTLSYPNKKTRPSSGKTFEHLTFNDATVIKVIPNDTTSPKIMLYRDSYAIFMIQPLSESFSKTALYWTNHFYKEPIDYEKPDIFVDELLSRFLDRLLIENPKEVKEEVSKYRGKKKVEPNNHYSQNGI